MVMVRDRGQKRPSAYWLLVQEIPGKPVWVVFTTEFDGGGKTLPVFTSGHSARVFLQSLGGEHLKIRQSSGGELLSLLYGLLSGVEHVVVDPPAWMTDHLEAIGRNSFAELLIMMDRERVGFASKRLRTAIEVDEQSAMPVLESMRP